MRGAKLSFVGCGGGMPAKLPIKPSAVPFYDLNPSYTLFKHPYRSTHRSNH